MGSQGFRSEVQDLLRRSETFLEGHAVHLPHVVSEPSVEWVLRGGDGLERAGEVVGFGIHHDEIAVGRRLTPDRLPGDPGPPAGILVGRLALTVPARGHRRPIHLRHPRK